MTHAREWKPTTSSPVNDETSDLYKLGYSMDSWDALLQRGRKAGFDDKVLASAGLVIERENKTGFYDRFLAHPNLTASSIGVGFEVQITPKLPRDDWDVPLHAIATERRWIQVG